MNKKRLMCLLLVLAMIFSIAGCGNGAETVEEPAEELTEEPAQEPQKDTLIVAASTDAASLDPHVQNDSHAEQIVAMIYNTLLKFEEDGTIVADLADSWQVSEDKKTWTFKLKEGVKFHNGKELTAEDVKGTYDRFMADDADAARLVVKEVTKMFEEIKVIDNYTVSITTSEPYGPMMALLCNRSLAIMDPDVIAEYGSATGDTMESVVGTGPYKMVSWKKDEELIVDRFEDYFNEPAKIREVKVRIVPEPSSRVIALETGEVDFIKQFPSEDMDRFVKDAAINVVKKSSVGSRLFRFGCDDPIMSNVKIRQAIVYAIDRDEIIEGLFPDMAYASTGPLTPVVWGYNDLGEIKQDQEKAMNLMAEAGYPDGFTTKIVTTPRYPSGVELAEILSAQLAEVGINAEIEVLEWSVLLPTWLGFSPEEFDEPIFIMGAGTSMMDADGGLRGLYTTTETGTNERNYGFYSNSEVDKLIQDAMKETDTEKRLSMYKRAEEILYLEDPVAIWLFDKYSIAAARSDVHGIEISGIGLVSFEKMYFE